MADKLIGKLTLDISDIEKKINSVNEFLGKIGANVNLEDKLSKKISEALNKLVSEAKKAGQEAQKAIEQATSGASANTSKGNDNIKEAVKLWKEYYTVLRQAETAYQGGNAARAQELRNEADAIKQRAEALRKESEVQKEIAAAKRQYETAYSNTGNKDRINQIKQEVKEQQELAKAVKEVQEMKRKTDQQVLAQSAKAEQEQLDHLISLYVKYFEYKTKAVNAESSGNNAGAGMFNGLAQNIQQQIADLTQYNQELKNTAENSDKVVAAQVAWQSAITASSSKEAAASMKENEASVKAYADALVALYNEQTKLNNAVASGKIAEGTAEYDAASQKIEHLEQAVVRAGEKLDQAGIKAANGMQSVQTAADNLVQSQARMADSSEVDALGRITDAYNNLKNAITQYNIAKKANNEQGMNYWQGEIDSQMAIVHSIQEAIGSLNVEAGVRDQINQKIQEAITLQNGFKAGVVGSTQGASELEMQLTGIATRLLSIMAIWRMMSSLVQNMVEYVSEYSDKMNEIQIITQKSNAEVAQLSETYKNIAEMMNVSTLDIAEAAVYFTRQGLPAAEIEQRLKNVTMYAKTANVEFKESSEIITAVVNSMGLVEQEAEDGRNATQRVADVFLKVGDNAATSGEEIGRAMQKAAASAGAFGVSFEWLTAAIATVSETTRQEARTIGTAFNTIIARLHQIRTTGYNQEDETKINDVAKALAKIDVALMDQYGNWRDMEDVWNDVAAKWGDLDGKTKSYIATSMAGVKQQNVFLAAMNDMSKKVEEGGRFWELYGLAMDSAGTAAEKYATWTDSVAASQERLNLAQEKFYSMLGSNVIKGWNDMMAGFVGMIADGAEAFGTWTVIIPVVIGGIVGLNTVLSMTGKTLTATFVSHPVMSGILVAIGVAGALVTAINAVGSAIETQKEKFEAAQKSLSDVSEAINSRLSLQSQLAGMIDDVGTEAKMTSSEISRYNGLLESLSAISPIAKGVVDDLRSGLIDQTDAAKALNDEIDRTIEKEQKLATINLIEKYSNWSPSNMGANKFVNTMGNWDELGLNAENTESFALALKDIYHRIENARDNANTFNGLINKFMTRDVYDEITKMYNQQRKTGEVDWGIIGDFIYSKFVGTDDMSGLTDVLMKYAEEAVDDVVRVLGVRLDSVEQVAFREGLTKAIMGEDFEIDIDEYREMGTRISNFLLDVLSGGWNYVDIGSPAILNAVGQNLFGNYFSMIFEDQIADAAKDTELVQSISEAYQELLAAGFENNEIAEVLENVPLKEWDQMVDLMKNHMVEKMRSEFGEDFMMFKDAFGGEDIDLFEDLDAAAVKLMLDMKRAGMSADEFLDLFIESGADMDVFAQKLADMSRGIVDGTDEAEEETETLLETIKKLTAEIDKYDKIINTLKKGEPVDMSDLLNIADAHPEIMAVVNDADSLLAAMQKLKEASMSDVVKNLRNNLLGSQEFAQQQTAFDTGGKTLGEYAASGNAEISNAVNRYVDQIVASFLAHSGQLQNVGKDIIGNWMNSLFSESNVDLLHRKAVQIGDDFATVLTETFTASTDGEEGLKWDANVVMNLTPITKDGKVLTREELNKYVEDLLKRSNDIEDLFTYDSIDNSGKGLLISAEEVGAEGFKAATENATTLMKLLHLLQEAYYGVAEAEKTWLELQIEQQELNASNEWAKNNGYIEQLSELNNALASGGSEGVIAATEIWNGYNQELQKAILDTYPELGRAILEAQEAIDKQTGSEEKAAAATEKLGKSLDKATKYATATKFKSTYDAIQKMQKGAISATGAYEAFDKELKEFEKAQKDVAEAQVKMADGTELTTEDVSNLASALGMTAQQVIDDFPGALEMFEELRQAGKDAFDDLNREATMRILGISEADFSNITNGLIAVQNDAKATIEMLKATGQWELVTEDLPADMPVFDVVNGKTVNVGTVTATGHQTLLRMKNTNPLSGGGGGGSSSSPKSGGGGGGGGGGGNKNKNQMTEVERILDNMSQINDIQKYQQSYYQSQNKYYDQAGMLQGVIAYSEREIEVLNRQTEAMEDNVEKINEYIAKKKAELATMTTSDEKYEEVSDDLDKLQKAHQEYTKQLIDNKTAVDELNKSIEEQRKKIRDMEINLRNTILKAIKDRESRTSDMLDAEIDMENKILDIIKQRYEKERDMIIETNNMKIDALNRERELLDEELRKRREIADAEDKQKRLNDLELKYQRIISDPTRLKEAQGIKQQIDDLRKQMAWDLAEEEIKAQQESIDQQIESLDDYIAQVEEYYDDLFKHPQKLIDEMREIIQMADEDIISWLKDQDESFASSSENTQLKMVEDWQNTLDQMHDVIKTYWDEVEEIISKGEDYIIEFLKENSNDYREAGKLQAEAYVDEWKKQLDDLKKAYEEVNAVIAPEYDTIEKPEGEGSGSGGGGGGGGSNNNTKAKYRYEATLTYVNKDYGYKIAKGKGESNSSEDEAKDMARQAAMENAKATGSYRDSVTTKYAAYKNGGIIDYTGPAWVDGSASLPERILNPYQNKLFETMVQALEQMSRVYVPTMPNFGDMQTAGGNSVSVGDIIVNVDNLDTDDDYEELANKVGEIIMTRIGRTTAIGGLRIQPF